MESVLRWWRGELSQLRKTEVVLNACAGCSGDVGKQLRQDDDGAGLSAALLSVAAAAWLMQPLYDAGF